MYFKYRKQFFFSFQVENLFLLTTPGKFIRDILFFLKEIYQLHLWYILFVN